MMPSLSPPRVVAACVSIAALSASGCASHAQTPPVVQRQAAATGTTEVAVRESFDPARFRQDLLLIDPVFTAPAVPSEPADVAPRLEIDEPADSVTVAVHRVQVIALRRQEGAQAIADELGRRFGVPAEVVSQGRLFAVRVGRHIDAAHAEGLRSQIIALSLGYEGAFLVSDTLQSATAAGPMVWENEGADDRPEAEVYTDAFSDSSLADSAPVDWPDDDLPVPEVDPPEAELVRVQGYRVLIDQFRDSRKAQELRGGVMRRLKREDVIVKFEAPYHKVLAGGFRTESQTQRFVERCRLLGYRKAAQFPDEVYLPREEQDNR
ncbi:MAG: SPOR domain-containing protein [Candidatus Latescibacteria bacterium]|nr:SPOR domain-containing protein [Candidatus Latescibacterota bacterium]MDP7448005.1 SPOR domain-containing protein [Candidatus Latescibacterota bacterium]HJP32208.1 SPOR domain-containing protein [Candidatus Latescibacterota bacterium]